MPSRDRTRRGDDFHESVHKDVTSTTPRISAIMTSHISKTQTISTKFDYEIPNGRTDELPSDISIFKESCSSLTEITSSGAPFTIWKSLRMKPDGAFVPPSWLADGDTSLILLSILMVIQ
jgi:hypothetical protein